MSNYLVCYEIGFLGEHGNVTGHSFVTMPSLTEQSLKELSSKIREIAVQQKPGLHLADLVFRSVTRLDY